MFGYVYKDRHIQVTGHTGFKRGWLVLWLEMPGAKVTGISLPPIEWEIGDQQQPYENETLQLDSDKARRELAWKSRMPVSGRRRGDGNMVSRRARQQRCHQQGPTEKLRSARPRSWASLGKEVP